MTADIGFVRVMKQILPVREDTDGIQYVPYINGGQAVLGPNDERRSDYDDILNRSDLHGGVDIFYGIGEKGVATDFLGQGEWPNTNALVFAPVTGKVLRIDEGEGAVAIMADDGYVHTIRHMKNIMVVGGNTVTAGNWNPEINQDKAIGTMWKNGVGITNIHVHYEITTYYINPEGRWRVEKNSKIDPEVFWDNYGVGGKYWLVGTVKEANELYGTVSAEIIKGENDVGITDGGGGYVDSDDDMLYGGGGSDIVDGGSGDDRLFGGNSYGKDKYYEIDKGVLTMSAAEDTDTSNDEIIGGLGSDALDGGKGDDKLYGGFATITNGVVDKYNPATDPDTGNDKLIGGDGEDTLEGGKGDDKLYGGIASIKDDGEVEYNANDDTDTFKDTLKGGEGYDTYYVAKKDVIEDSDGKGIVYLKGNDNALTAASRKAGEVDYVDGYGRKYTLNGSTLTVEGHLKIEKFQNGDLGIWLFEEEEDEKGNIKYTPVKTDFDRAKLNLSPIVLDLDGDGVQTQGLKDFVFFDHDGNEFAERTGWVETGDGLLVRDLDGNGKIETGAELFGNNTLLKNGQMAANGYEAMADLDDNFDGKIDQNDAAWNELRIWQDINSDGLSQAGELKTLDELRIQSLNVEYIDINLTDVKKNEHRQESTFTRTDGLSGSTTGTTEDVWFDVDLINSKPVNRLDVSDAIKELPEIKGMGNVAGLWQTMAKEEANGSNQLKTLLEQFIQTDVTDQNTLSNLTRQIIYAWTGVEDKDPASRGYWIGDARVIYALETLVAEPFVNKNYGTEGPYSGAAYNLNYAFNQFAATVQAQLMQQAQFEAYYDAITYSLDENHNVIRDLTAVVPLLTAELEANHELGKKKLVLFIANFMQTNGTDNVDAQAFNTAFVPYGQDVVLVAQMAWQKKIVIADYYNPLIGDDSDEIISALDANDEIGGGGGNDRLYGGRGNDYLGGRKGNDLLFCPMPNAILPYFTCNASYKIMASGNIKASSANQNEWRGVA